MERSAVFTRTGEIYVGLFDYVCEWLDSKGYPYTIGDSKHYGSPKDIDSYVTLLSARILLDLWVCLQGQRLSTQSNIRGT